MSSEENGYKGWHFHFEEEYSQFFKKCNWYTYNVFKCEVDRDKFTSSVDLTFIILGLGFRVTWNYSLNQNIRGIIKTISELKTPAKDKNHD